MIIHRYLLERSDITKPSISGSDREHPFLRRGNEIASLQSFYIRVGCNQRLFWPMLFIKWMTIEIVDGCEFKVSLRRLYVYNIGFIYSLSGKPYYGYLFIFLDGFWQQCQACQGNEKKQRLFPYSINKTKHSVEFRHFLGNILKTSHRMWLTSFFDYPAMSDRA